MATGTIRAWEAPNRTSLGEVSDHGVVVNVRFAPQEGQPAVVPDASGIMPHVEYVAEREPQGTTSFQTYNPVTNQVGPPLGRPLRHNITSSFASNIATYWIDVNTPFVCPWPGRIWIAGGAVGSGSRASISRCDVEFVRSRPEFVSDEFEFVADQTFLPRDLLNFYKDAGVPITDLSALPYSFKRRFTFSQGTKPLLAPTITFCNVGNTPVPIPYGAKSFQTDADSQVVFIPPGGVAGHDQVTVTSNRSGQMQIGSFVGGTFNSIDADTTIALVSFTIDLA